MFILRATEHMDFRLTEFLMRETSQNIVYCYQVNLYVAGSLLMKAFMFGGIKVRL